MRKFLETRACPHQTVNCGLLRRLQTFSFSAVSINTVCPQQTDQTSTREHPSLSLGHNTQYAGGSHLVREGHADQVLEEVGHRLRLVGLFLAECLWPRENTEGLTNKKKSNQHMCLFRPKADDDGANDELDEARRCSRTDPRCREHPEGKHAPWSAPPAPRPQQSELPTKSTRSRGEPMQ